MQTTLVDSLTQTLRSAIQSEHYGVGTKLPSVRMAAQLWEVSNFTVIQAYDRLIAQGWLQSRRGSGFFVLKRPFTAQAVALRAQESHQGASIDVPWLLRNMFREMSAHSMPASGTVPTAWLDDAMLSQASRAIARDPSMNWLTYAAPQGWAALREQLALGLAPMGIHARAEQILTTAGATQGFTLITRALTRPGDVVLVDSPGWFVLFATLAGIHRQVIGVPRLIDGPDLECLQVLVAQHKPKLYITQSILHNPTSGSLSAAKAKEILRLAEQHQFHIIEDDVYTDLHPGEEVQTASRLASLDGLRRVIYLSGFSKTLAPNLRVGYIAADSALMPLLTDHKMLAALSTPEFGERIVHHILSNGQYRKHLDRLKSKLDQRRPSALRGLIDAGVCFPELQRCGLFAWGELNKDASEVAKTLLEKGFVLAPGTLFHPEQAPSTRMRFNLATSSHPEMLRELKTALA